MQRLFATRGLLIADHLSEVFEEYRNLVYKGSEVDKKENDILDAIRFIVMAHREAKILVPGGGSRKPTGTYSIREGSVSSKARRAGRSEDWLPGRSLGDGDGQRCW